MLAGEVITESKAGASERRLVLKTKSSRKGVGVGSSAFRVLVR